MRRECVIETADDSIYSTHATFHTNAEFANGAAINEYEAGMRYRNGRGRILQLTFHENINVTSQDIDFGFSFHWKSFF